MSGQCCFGESFKMVTPRKLPIALYFCSMREHHTKSKGDLGVLKASADLCAKGYLVCLPFSEHTPFDLVIYKNGLFKRVQVKSRKVDNQGVLMIGFRNSYSTSKGVQTIEVDKTEVDLNCIYCIDNDTCYYFNPISFNKSVSIRVKAPKNNQSARVHLAVDFREVP